MGIALKVNDGGAIMDDDKYKPDNKRASSAIYGFANATKGGNDALPVTAGGVTKGGDDSDESDDDLMIATPQNATKENEDDTVGFIGSGDNDDDVLASDGMTIVDDVPKTKQEPDIDRMMSKEAEKMYFEDGKDGSTDNGMV